MENKLAAELKDRLNDKDLREVVRAMGYPIPLFDKPIAWIEFLVNDRDLGLTKGFYDFRFNSTEFLTCLCQVLKIDSWLVQCTIHDLLVDINRRHTAFRCWIFIKTGPLKYSQPAFARAMLESRRRLLVSETIRLMPVVEQVEQVREIVRNHYQRHEGCVDFWGEIESYLYTYAKDTTLIFNPDGSVRDDAPPEHIPAKASLSVGGREMSPLVDSLTR